jgi:hypothetical protein
VVAFEAVQQVDLSGCRHEGGPTGKGYALVIFAQTGKVSAVRLQAEPYAGTDVGACIVQKLGAVRIQPFGAGLPQVPMQIEL